MWRKTGGNLSTVLFSLFLNDLDAYLSHKNNAGVVIDIENEDFYIYLKIIILLYTDDTVILARDPDSLQKCLNDFYDYCKEWKLDIHTEKPKVIILAHAATVH